MSETKSHQMLDDASAFKSIGFYKPSHRGYYAQSYAKKCAKCWILGNGIGLVLVTSTYPSYFVPQRIGLAHSPLPGWRVISHIANVDEDIKAEIRCNSKSKWQMALTVVKAYCGAPRALEQYIALRKLAEIIRQTWKSKNNKFEWPGFKPWSDQPKRVIEN